MESVGFCCRDFGVCLPIYFYVYDRIINFIPGITNLTFFRSLRLLRSLTSFSKIASLQVLLLTMIQSISSLVDAFMLLTFFIFIFSMISTQLFRGVLTYRCFDPVTSLFTKYFIILFRRIY